MKIHSSLTGRFIAIVFILSIVGSTAFAQSTQASQGSEGTQKCVKELKRFITETCYSLPWWQQPACIALAGLGYTGCVKSEAGPIVR